MADTDYAVGYVIYGGAVLAEVMDVELEEDSNDKPVDTLAKGRSGHSSGAEACKLTLKTAIPRKGYEVNFHRICRRHETVQVRFRLGALERTVEGRIMTAKSSTAVNNPAACDATFDGKVISEVAI